MVRLKRHSAGNNGVLWRFEKKIGRLVGNIGFSGRQDSGDSRKSPEGGEKSGDAENGAKN